MASGGNPVAALATAWVVLAVGGAALVPVAGWAFTWLDVSRDKPA